MAVAAIPQNFKIMKYEVNNDLVWKRGNALANLWFFVNYMVCSGHPHIKVSCTDFCVEVIFFMEKEDNVEDIKEIASHYLSDLWKSDLVIVNGDDGLGGWISFKYHWKD